MNELKLHLNEETLKLSMISLKQFYVRWPPENFLKNQVNEDKAY